MIRKVTIRRIATQKTRDIRFGSYVLSTLSGEVPASTGKGTRSRFQYSPDLIKHRGERFELAQTLRRRTVEYVAARCFSSVSGGRPR